MVGRGVQKKKMERALKECRRGIRSREDYKREEKKYKEWCERKRKEENKK